MIKELLYELFYDHKQLSDQEIKNCIQEKLIKDKNCSQQLHKLDEKANKEYTSQNAIWVQSVLEIIFDESYLSTKIDTNIIESYTRTIIDTESISDEHTNIYSPSNNTSTDKMVLDEPYTNIEDDV
ncbi:hypothetical protein GLOIN_2v1766060 [Rhizophagus clarus]|uniref:Uncharacterized protein n=1 Tax=Rhizophagus clarus TaxID=94130 RepID=A0A8H3QFB2_9GLOM|nr:hypothetical protein GLOIN_2v1766060 [Rhizophagus clarus]